MSFEHILVATDFSDASSQAAAAGAELARRMESRATLVHSYDPMPLGPAGAHLKRPSKVAEQKKQLSAAALAELEKCRDAHFDGIEDVSLAVLEDDSPALAVCDFAKDNDAKLVVVGTHGHARLTRWLIGGVAEKIVRRAPCSVLAVRPTNGRARKLWRNILVGTDFSPAAEPALDAAAEIATTLGAKLTLVYCYDRAVPLLPPMGAPDDLSRAEQIEANVDDLRGAVASLLRAKVGDESKGRAELLISRNPAASMCSYADDHGVDLVVVGAQGRTGRDRMFIGGVAEKVLRHASCSVLTVR
jgi:nucleotide-binding universal stress UspA family protein